MKPDMKANLEGWTLFDEDDKRAIAQALYPATKNLLNILLESVTVDLPFVYGRDTDGYLGDPVDDPLALYLTYEADDDYQIMAKCSLVQAIDEHLGFYSSGEDDKKRALLELSAALRRQADKIDKVLDEKS